MLAKAAALLSIVLVTSSAFAQDYPSIDGPFEAKLDMDHDGTMDQAVLVRHADDGALADLSIYLGAGAGKLTPSIKPTFFKSDLTVAGIISLEGDNNNGSLALTYGCGGCSSDYETTLTIVYRDGEFLVGGYSYGWETRESIGSCEIDYLAGKGVLTEGLDGEGVAIKEKFTPVKLADWSDDKRPAACDL